MVPEATSNSTVEIHDREHEELNRLFNLYRLCNLNVRYYGCRAEKYERRSWRLDMGSGATSALALGVLLLVDWSPEAAVYARRIAAGLAGLAALLTAIAPLTGWAAKAKRFCNLHSLYSQLFGQVESVITWIRRDGLSAESIGASKQVHEAYRQMHALDELEPDQELIDREDLKVRQAFPDTYIWENF